MLSKSKLLWLAVLLLASVAFGQTACPEQTFRDPATCPATLDISKIAVDPNTNKPCLLDWKFATQGKTWTVSGKYCHKAGYPVTLTASTGTLSFNAGTWTVNGQAPKVEIIYLAITIIDAPPVEGQATVTRKGTVAIIVLPPPNPGPVLYTPAPVAQWNMWPYPQQREVVRQFKLTGEWWHPPVTGL